MRPAGYSSGTGVGTRGGWAAGRCVPVAATRVASPERGGVAVGDGGGSLRVAFCARSRLSYDPLGSVLRSAHAHHALLLGGFAFDHACLFSFVRKRETACGMLHFYSARGRDRLSAFSDVVRLSGFAWFTSGLCVSLRRSRRRTKGRGERSRRRGVGTLLRNHISLVMFSAGRTLGLKCGSRTAAAPDCAKESKVEAALRPLWTLFF